MEEIFKLWNELNWINNEELRNNTAAVWADAVAKSPLTIQDLNEIPFTLLVKDCKVTFMEHKRAVVHIAKRSAEAMVEHFGDKLPINMDFVVSGAILCDVGKLLEYEKIDGKAVVSNFGSFVRHPFSGVALAMERGLPPEVCHIIAAHAAEGDLVKRSTEAYIVHHSDFMSYLPFTKK